MVHKHIYSIQGWLWKVSAKRGAWTELFRLTHGGVGGTSINSPVRGSKAEMEGESVRDKDPTGKSFPTHLLLIFYSLYQYPPISSLFSLSKPALGPNFFCLAIYQLSPLLSFLPLPWFPFFSLLDHWIIADPVLLWAVYITNFIWSLSHVCQCGGMSIYGKQSRNIKKCHLA